MPKAWKKTPPKYRKKKKSSDELLEMSPKSKKWMIKIILIIAALVLLQIPLLMVKQLACERKTQSESVQNEIAGVWAWEQKIQLFPAASTEKISAEITPEIRYRGIYQAVVYTAKVTINAEYKNIASPVVATVVCSEIKGVLGVSAKVNGKSVNVENDADKRLKFQLPRGDSKCEITLSLRGSRGLQFIPSANESNILIYGDNSRDDYNEPEDMKRALLDGDP